MEYQIKRAKELVKHNQVKKISEKYWEVEDKNIFLQISSGKKMLLCDCKNSSIHAHNQICYHVLAVILFEADNKFYQKLNKIIEDYKKYEHLKMKIEPYLVLNDLNDLKNAK